MNTADLITSFFNNELNPEQERQFLLTVAASDSMRLGLKSHVMLDRILAERAKEVHVPDSVRNVIFAEAGAMLAGTASTAPSDESASTPRQGPRRFKGGSARIGAGLLAVTLALVGFGAGYMTHSELEVQRVPEPSSVLVPHAPQDQHSIVSAPHPAPATTLTTQSAVHDPNVSSVTAEQSATPVVSTARPNSDPRQSQPVSSVRSTRTATLRETVPSVEIPALQTKQIEQLDPEERALLTRQLLQSAQATGGSDSIVGETQTDPSTFTPTAVSATPSIRKPSDSDRAKDHDSRRP